MQWLMMSHLMAHHESPHLDLHTGCLSLNFKGRFLEFRMYHNFANLFSKLSENTFYKEISKFQ